MARKFGFHSGRVISKEVYLKPEAAPVNPKAGMLYYDSSANKLKVYNGSAWETVTSSS